MITFIKNWYKTKKAEMAFKAVLYATIATFTDDWKEIAVLLKNVYISLKDVPVDELRHEIINRIAESAHEQAVKEREAGKQA